MGENTKKLQFVKNAAVVMIKYWEKLVIIRARAYT